MKEYLLICDFVACSIEVVDLFFIDSSLVLSFVILIVFGCEDIVECSNDLYIFVEVVVVETFFIFLVFLISFFMFEVVTA